MNKFLAPITLVMALGTPAPTQDSIWHDDWTAARALAKQEGKPLLVLFR